MSKRMKMSKKGGKMILKLLLIVLVIAVVLKMLRSRRMRYGSGLEAFGCGEMACS